MTLLLKPFVPDCAADLDGQKVLPITGAAGKQFGADVHDSSRGHARPRGFLENFAQ